MATSTEIYKADAGEVWLIESGRGAVWLGKVTSITIRAAESLERFAAASSEFGQAVARREEHLALARLESRRWLAPWMGAGLTMVVALVAIWSG